MDKRMGQDSPPLALSDQFGLENQRMPTRAEQDRSIEHE